MLLAQRDEGIASQVGKYWLAEQCGTHCFLSFNFLTISKYCIPTDNILNLSSLLFCSHFCHCKVLLNLSGTGISRIGPLIYTPPVLDTNIKWVPIALSKNCGDAAHAWVVTLVTVLHATSYLKKPAPLKCMALGVFSTFCFYAATELSEHYFFDCAITAGYSWGTVS